LKQCVGALIVGVPQIEIADGTWKGGPVTGVVLPTEWNQIEAGLAHSLNLPLMVIAHEGISNGVFERGVVGRFIFEVDMTDSGWPISKEIIEGLRTWRETLPDSPPLKIEWRPTGPVPTAAGTDLSDIHFSVLALFGDASDGALEADEVAYQMDFSEQRAQHFIDGLVEATYLHGVHSYVSPSVFHLTSEGRSALAKRGLLE